MATDDRQIAAWETELATARVARTEASKHFTPTAGWDNYRRANEAVLQLERNLAEARGEPYALPLEFPVEWDTGAPCPQLLQNDDKTFLIFFVANIDPNWDGSYVISRNPVTEVAKLAVVEFFRCSSAKLGCPNDEVLNGHYLYGKGQEAYTAQLVANSPWISEIQKINKVHHRYDPELWTAKKHFVFWFHDTTFECVAESFGVKLFNGTLPDLLAEVCKKLVG